MKTQLLFSCLLSATGYSMTWDNVQILEEIRHQSMTKENKIPHVGHGFHCQKQGRFYGCGICEFNYAANQHSTFYFYANPQRL